MLSQPRSSSTYTTSPPARERKTRVMIVDDSAVSRGVLTKIFESDPATEIVASLPDGQAAIDKIEEANPDVIILDIEMPVMDGLTALPLLLARKPDVKILVFSGHSKQGADISIQALYAGAAECLLKPSKDIDTKNYREDLLRIVKTLTELPDREYLPRRPSSADDRTYILRGDDQTYNGKPEIIAIGSSTGGPKALFSVLRHLTDIDVPVIITQHMPATFTSVLAQHLSYNSDIACIEAQDGMAIEGGRIYLAPGDKHMEVVKDKGHPVIKLNDGPKVNFCRPAIDPMIRSAAKLYGEKTLAVILTGMGRDGLESCRELAAKGGKVIAQDKDSSIIWGMPGAVAMAGLCSAVLPLNDVGLWIKDAIDEKHETQT